MRSLWPIAAWSFGMALACGAPAEDPILAALRRNPMVLTRHGECRMACRDLSREDVAFVLEHGRIDPGRTRHDGDCPSYALEGDTPDGQRARVVFAACDAETRLVTAIDLDKDWPCDCR